MSVLGQDLIQNFAGPVLVDYVWWILQQAHQRNLKELYFLARDGYLLCEIAQQLCAQFGLKIECRYLYCSRAALRMPSYHLLDRSEMDDLLLQGGYRVTIRSILQRIELDELQQERVCEESGLKQMNLPLDQLLNHQEYERVQAVLKRSTLFHQYAMEKSKMAYETAIGYLRQEGLLKQEHIALVDSGWTGSMQRSLRQLLQSAGFSGGLTGFYFGMYVPPKDAADGTYVTWYFRHNSREKDKICFNNNLFECLLPAPHGMTTGYTGGTNGYKPQLLAPAYGRGAAWIEQYVRDVLKYTQNRMRQKNFSDFSAPHLWQETHQIVLRHMVHPTREEAEYLGKLLLCDDITETYYLALAEPEQVSALKDYFVFRRVLRKVFKRPLKVTAEPRLLWPFGVVAFLPAWKQLWYRWNIYLGEWIRHKLQ